MKFSGILILTCWASLFVMAAVVVICKVFGLELPFGKRELLVYVSSVMGLMILSDAVRVWEKWHNKGDL